MILVERLDLGSLWCLVILSLICVTMITHPMSVFQVRAMVVIVTCITHTNYPLLAIYLFSMQNQKKVVNLTNQLPTTFEERCQDQLARLEGMVLAPYVLH